MTYDPASANPLAGNPLKTRADMCRALSCDLFDPLLPFFSAGNARVTPRWRRRAFRPGGGRSRRFCAAALGTGAAGAGGGDFAHWHRFAEGSPTARIPTHPEYWGTVNGRDQRMVELAAIGFALALVPELIWEPLDARRARRTSRPISCMRRQFDYANNNWKFFRVLRRSRARSLSACRSTGADASNISRSSTASISATAGIATATCAASTTTFRSRCTSTA